MSVYQRFCLGFYAFMLNIMLYIMKSTSFYTVADEKLNICYGFSVPAFTLRTNPNGLVFERTMTSFKAYFKNRVRL